ncbi:uncharacterized protein LOC109842729 isoform X1 [Asparagus officinalis]|uniref:uncharacterized protein LOC109842729 isoform X1 n=1 Tax=Asparagus officinalis TaxID=4686 RepID=UPI00098E7FA6|nr:uncharacterized protein LOC109842729 isoform X1 [Asparagus officinalis]XP_020267185.1 uncharacterized protein LOC109842729 isoform X1 [Asparagus officinalis]
MESRLGLVLFFRLHSPNLIVTLSLSNSAGRSSPCRQIFPSPGDQELSLKLRPLPLRRRIQTSLSSLSPTDPSHSRSLPRPANLPLASSFDGLGLFPLDPSSNLDSSSLNRVFISTSVISASPSGSPSVATSPNPTKPHRLHLYLPNLRPLHQNDMLSVIYLWIECHCNRHSVNNSCHLLPLWRKTYLPMPMVKWIP